MTPHPFDELPVRGKQPSSARNLDAWINQAQDRSGIAAGRLGWLVASSITIAALQRARHVDERPRFLLKGGAYLELKLGLASRATRDVDTLFRGNFEEFVETLDRALTEPWGVIELSRTEITVIENARRVVKPRRFSVKLSVRGRTWRSVDVEVAADEGQAGANVSVLPGVPLDHFGLPSPLELAGIVLDYQVAQKLHACTDPHDPPALVNDRSRDIVDLTLLRDAFYASADLAVLREACEDLFFARAEDAARLGIDARPWPPDVIAHEHWQPDFERLAREVGLEADLGHAVAALREWVGRIAIA